MESKEAVEALVVSDKWSGQCVREGPGEEVVGWIEGNLLWKHLLIIQIKDVSAPN